MIGLFVTALVGIYTIEDLWEKFGDTKMPVVRPLVTLFAGGSRQTDTFVVARPTKTLGCTCSLPHHRPHPRLHGFFQNPFHGLEPFRAR